MTDEELAAIKARVEAATPGPWAHRISIVQCEAQPGMSIVQGYTLNGKFDENMDFIAAAREDVPRLLDEVERLRAENAALREIVQQVATMPNGQQHMAEGTWAVCPFACGAAHSNYWERLRLNHTPDCPVTKARALLGGVSRE